jgi:hypothetical protein
VTVLVRGDALTMSDDLVKQIARAAGEPEWLEDRAPYPLET